MADPAAWHGKRLQLHGFVDRDRTRSATRSTTASRCRATAASSRPATRGVVPDTFKDGAEVVLKGTLSADGFHVERNGVMAKCPSKYEPSKAAPPARPPRLRTPPAASRRSRTPPCLRSAICCCSQRSSLAPTRSPRRSPARGAARRRLIESGIGAFYLVTALMTVASGVIVHAFVTNNYSIKYVAALLGRGAAARLQDRLVLGRPRRLDDVLGVPAVASSASIAVYINRERHRELIPYVVAVIAVDADVLPLPDGGAQQPVLDLPDAAAARRSGV